jgi:hypothetical protein
LAAQKKTGEDHDEKREVRMRCKKFACAVLFIINIATFSHSALVFHRDTLHILSNYGREVSFSAKSGQFTIDSIVPGRGAYPCSLSHKGIFFASLGGFYACPCCPTWSIGSSRPFYRVLKSQVNWSAPLILSDAGQFRKSDTSKSYGCYLPQAIPNSYDGNIFIFSTELLSRTGYLLVRVDTLYLDLKKPTQTGGGDLGYPFETCKNMLVVSLYLQTDGSTNFAGAQITPILVPDNQTRGVKRPLPEAATSSRLYTLQGRSVTIGPNGTYAQIPRGCYFVKCGNGLKKQVLFNP